MLTEIEWWGGLLFIWLGVYGVMVFTDETTEPGIFETVSNICFFLSFALVLLLYFYWHEGIRFQYLYLGALCFAAVMMAVDHFVFADDEGETIQDDDEEELEGIWLAVGNTIAYVPYLIIFGLGLSKAWPTINMLL